MRIGVLSLQGDFAEHVQAFREIGADAEPVKTPKAVRACAGLVLPGGESTTMGLVAQRNGLLEALQRFVHTRPVFVRGSGAPWSGIEGPIRRPG